MGGCDLWLMVLRFVGLFCPCSVFADVHVPQICFVLYGFASLASRDDVPLNPVGKIMKR